MRTAPKCLGGREVVDRQRLDPVLPRELYQDRRWSSPQIAAHLDSTVKSNGAADPARPWHPGPPRRTAAPPDTRRWPAVDRPVQRPGDHCAAAPPPDPAAAPTRRHHRPLPRGSCAPRTWTSGWPRCTSSNSPDTPPNRSWTYCTSTASTASRSSAPAATPPGCRRHHHHLRWPAPDNPVPPVPRVDGGRMPAPARTAHPRPAAGQSCTAVSPIAGPRHRTAVVPDGW